MVWTSPSIIDFWYSLYSYFLWNWSQFCYKFIIQSLWRCVPGVAIYFTCLETMKSVLLQTRIDKKLVPLEALVLGASARCVSGIVLMPFTVMKTRFEVLNNKWIYCYDIWCNFLLNDWRVAISNTRACWKLFIQFIGWKEDVDWWQVWGRH